jgi:hypothetical protein
MPRRQMKMISHGLSTTWNIALSTTRKSYFEPIIRQNEFSGRIHPLKKRLFDLDKVAFWVCLKAENPVAGCFETMKHRFIDFIQVVICEGQKLGNEFLGLLHYLKYLFIDFNKSHLRHLEGR